MSMKAQTAAFSAILALAGSFAAWGGGFAGLNERIKFRTYQTVGEPGVLTIVNGSLISTSTGDHEKKNRTDFPSTMLCEPDETKGIAVEVGECATLNLMRDTTVSSIAVLKDSASIRLNGHVLSVTGPCRKSVRAKILRQTVPVEDAEGNPGRIDWVRGLMLIVR